MSLSRALRSRMAALALTMAGAMGPFALAASAQRATEPGRPAAVPAPVSSPRGALKSPVAPQPPAGPTAREQEIQTCRPGEWSTWGDGQDRAALSRPLRFIYRHEAAPAWFEASQVLALARRAVDGWAACGVPATVQALPRGQAPQQDDIQILWTDVGSRGQFALANLSARTLSLSPGLFRLLRERNPAYPADQTLQMALSHEMGHFYGLRAHSRRCVDVMSYYDDGKGHRCTLREPSAWGSVAEYRSALPTACDIERCRALNAGSAPRP